MQNESWMVSVFGIIDENVTLAVDWHRWLVQGKLTGDELPCAAQNQIDPESDDSNHDDGYVVSSRGTGYEGLDRANMDPRQTPADHYTGLGRHEYIEIIADPDCEDQSQVCRKCISYTLWHNSRPQQASKRHVFNK